MRIVPPTLCLVSLCLMSVTGCLKEAKQDKKDDGTPKTQVANNGKKEEDAKKEPEKKDDGKKEDDKKAERPTTASGIKVELGHLEKEWGVVPKKLTLEPHKKGGKVIILLEFVKDYDSTTVPVLEKAFPKGNVQSPVRYHLFDEDNEELSVAYHERLSERVTGRKGETFRIAIELGSVSAKTKRIEARQNKV